MICSDDCFAPLRDFELRNFFLKTLSLFPNSAVSRIQGVNCSTRLSIAKSSTIDPILSIILAFFGDFDCLGGSCPSDLIPSLYLVDILAVPF